MKKRSAKNVENLLRNGVAVCAEIAGIRIRDSGSSAERENPRQSDD